jgi:DNA repair protein RecO (recombination protein O)
MLLKTRAIVFRAVKYGETSLIVELFTEERGVHSFILSGVRSVKAKFSPALLQPMSVIEIVTYFKDNSEMHRIKEVQSGLVFQHIPFELRKGSVALFMAEVCRKSIRETESDAFLFDFIVKTLDFLDKTKMPIANLHLYFMLQLSSALGFLPGGEATTVTPFFDLQEGLFCEIRPPHPFFLNEIESAIVFKLLHVEMENCHEIEIQRPVRKAILGHLLQFFKLHLDQFGEIKTPDILEMVLAE